MKLQTLFDHFLFHCEVERGLSVHTVDSYRHDLNQYAVFLDGRNSIGRALNAEQLKAFLTDMSRRRNLSPSTVRRRLACLKALSRFAAERFAVKNPFNDWAPKIKRTKRLPRAIPRNDIAKLLKPKDPNKDPEVTFILSVLGVTGLRISELCALTAYDVSARGDELHVKGKGSKDRLVYITHKAIQKEMRDRRKQRLDSRDKSAHIFTNSRGAPMRPQTLRRRLHKYVGELGHDATVTPHMFRHSAATLLIEQGTDIRIVQKLLGHASISTTEIYTHVSNETLRSALNKANTLGGIL